MNAIDGIPIGPGYPCRIVAEISNNHNGKLENALRLIRECAEAGADFVKFQCYTPDELVRLRGDGAAPDPWGAQGWSMHDLYKKAQTPHEWFPYLVEECEDAGVSWFASVFGPESFDLLESLDCPAYKFAALDVDTPFVAALSLQITHVPVIVSARKESVDWADFTLFCPPGYPQDLSAFDGVSFDEFDGISFHGDRWALPAWATNEANIVEVHVQLDDEPSKLEREVSLTVTQLRKVCTPVGGGR